MADEIKYKMDNAKAAIYEDSAPEKLTKLYFYELSNTVRDKKFLQSMATSLVFVGKEQTINGILSVSEDYGMEPTDEYSNYSQQWRKISQIDVQTNEWINDDHITQFVVIGEPLDIDKYDKGDQALYYIMNKVIAKKPNNDPNVTNGEGEVTFTLVNFNEELKKYDNARVLLHRFPNLGKLTTKIGVTTQNQAMIHSIFAKGLIAPVGNDGRYSDIDFTSDKPMAPMRIQVAYIEDKVVLDLPWFDYDMTMPLFAARLYETGGLLSLYVNNADDRKLVEDMLFFSYMFANEFKDIPTITDASAKNYGELDPAYTIGHQGVQGSKVWSQDPTNVIDKLLISHKQRHPAFAISRSRYQPVYQMINALSQYVFSSMATAGGNNSMHMALLPWYLELSGDDGLKPTIDTAKKTIVPNTTTKFIAKSVYFNDHFGSGIAEHGSTGFDLVHNLKMSNMKTVQADKKILLDIMPDTLRETDISLSPIDQSTDDMGYIVYLPLDKDQWEKMMLNSPDNVSNTQTAVERIYGVPNGPIGKRSDATDAENAVKLTVDGSSIVAHTTASQVDSVNKYNEASILTGGGSDRFDRYKGEGDWELYFFGDRSGNVSNETPKSESDMKQDIHDRFGWDLDTITIHHDERNGRTYYWYTVSHTEFSDITLRVPAGSGGKQFGVNGRETRFDKQEWKELLLDYGFIPSSETTNTYTERKGWEIKELDELNIKSLKQDNFTLIFYPGNEQIKVGSITGDNEQISSNLFLFT